MSLMPFHLAIAVSDVATARQFYGEQLQCPEGRSDKQWVDFNFFGHQLVCHERPAEELPRYVRDGKAAEVGRNPVDGHQVPIPHFGVVLEWSQWETLAGRLKNANMRFIIEPYVRFRGKPGEQATMFFLDPFGHALEFKAFANPGDLFRKD